MLSNEPRIRLDPRVNFADPFSLYRSRFAGSQDEAAYQRRFEIDLAVMDAITRLSSFPNWRPLRRDRYPHISFVMSVRSSWRRQHAA